VHITAWWLVAWLSAAPATAPPAPDRLKVRPRVDVAVTLAAGALWIASEAERGRLAPRTCRWCDGAPGADRLNGLDAWGRRTLRWTNTGRAATLSGVVAYAAAPAVAYGLDWAAAHRDGHDANVPTDALLITEAMTVAANATQLLKFLVGRERPFVHVLSAAAKPLTAAPDENNLSFPSGHTSLAFSVVSASAEIGALRGYTRARWTWALGLPVATMAAYLRVAADRHYVTDVMAGAALGWGMGFAVPYLAHRQARDARVPALRLVPTGGDRMLAAVGQW
jgi:membrane-associated phospholipid phosphatase